MPAGRVSVTVTFPDTFDGPVFVTAIVKTPSVTAVELPACAFVISRSADVTTLTASVSWLLAVLGSLVAEPTVTALVSAAVAAGATWRVVLKAPFCLKGTATTEIDTLCLHDALPVSDADA